MSQQPHDLHFEVKSADGTLQGSMDVNESNIPSSQIPDYPASGRQSALSQSSHPVACIFHVLFKLGALLLYIFGGFFVRENGKVSGASKFTLRCCHAVKFQSEMNCIELNLHTHTFAFSLSV